MLPHHVTKLEFRSRLSGRSVADREASVTLEKLDERVIPSDPSISVSQVLEMRLRLGVRGLVIQELVVRLALHVRLTGENEHFDRVSKARGCGYREC